MLLKEKTKKKEKSANLQTMKQTNLTLLFGLIQKHRSVSRAELANVTGLSPTTVSSLVDEMLERGFVHQTGAGVSETSGRKPIILEIDPQGGYFAGIELTNFGLHCEFFDLTGESKSFAVFHVPDYSNIANAIVSLVEDEMKRLHIEREKLFGICMGVPGILDSKTHRVIESTVLPAACDNGFFNLVKEHFFETAVLIGNESHFCAYYEKSKMGDSVHSLVYIDINIGLGAGIILDDRIFTGYFGNAGEIGHISIDLNGPVCKCGKRGCLETLASTPAIEKRAAALLGSNPGFLEIAERFVQGDADIYPVIEETATYLAYGIDTVVNMINPEAVIIGGQISLLGETFLEMVRTRLFEICFEPSVQKIILKYSNVQGNPVTNGCARFLMDRVFKQEIFFE